MRYTQDEIIDHIQFLHRNSEDFESGDILDRINANAYYILEEVNLDFIKDGEFALEDDLVEEYLQMEGKAPAIVLNNDGSIIDGEHRVAVAKQKKLKTISAYIGQN